MKYKVHLRDADETLEVDCGSIGVHHGSLVIFKEIYGKSHLSRAIAPGRWDMVELIDQGKTEPKP